MTPTRTLAGLTVLGKSGLDVAVPAPRDRAPAHTAAEADEQDHVAVLELPRGDRLGECDRNRGGAGVAVAVDVDDDALRRHLEMLRGGVDDAPVRLVRDQPGDVLPRDVRAGERDVGRLDHLGDGEAKDLTAVHHDLVAFGRDVVGADRGGGGTADLDVEVLRIRTVGTELRGQERVLFARFEHDRARAVAEQDRGRTIVVVDDARELFGADQQHALEDAGAHEARRDGEPVDEAAAGDLDVERRDARDAELRTDDAGGGGERIVRGDGGDDDATQVARLDPRRRDRLARRAERDLARGLLDGRDVALFHPRARGD